MADNFVKLDKNSYFLLVGEVRTLREKLAKLEYCQLYCEQQQIWQDLEERNRLLSGVATAANCLLSVTDYDDSINAALAALGQAAVVDRVYIFKNYSHPETGELLMEQGWEWVAPGIKSEINNPLLKSINYKDSCPRWYETLSQGDSVVGVIEDFPDSEKEILRSQGIRSIFAMPIQIKGEFWGFIGFDDCHKEHQWSECEQLVLKSAVGNLGSAIVRHQTEVQLRESQEFLKLVIDNIPQFIFWKDCNSVYLGCNTNFARISGVGEPENIIGLTDNDLPWKDSQSNFFHKWDWDRQVLQTGIPRLNILEHEQQADGKQSWVNTNKIPLFGTVIHRR